jgi:hypothetical protein
MGNTLPKSAIKKASNDTKKDSTYSEQDLKNIQQQLGKNIAEWQWKIDNIKNLNNNAKEVQDALTPIVMQMLTEYEDKSEFLDIKNRLVQLTKDDDIPVVTNFETEITEKNAIDNASKIITKPNIVNAEIAEQMLATMKEYLLKLTIQLDIAKPKLSQMKLPTHNNYLNNPNSTKNVINNYNSNFIQENQNNVLTPVAYNSIPQWMKESIRQRPVMESSINPKQHTQAGEEALTQVIHSKAQAVIAIYLNYKQDIDPENAEIDKKILSSVKETARGLPDQKKLRERVQNTQIYKILNNLRDNKDITTEVTGLNEEEAALIQKHNAAIKEEIKLVTKLLELALTKEQQSSIPTLIPNTDLTTLLQGIIKKEAEKYQNKLCASVGVKLLNTVPNTTNVSFN